jgi:hypothetical protein
MNDKRNIVVEVKRNPKATTIESLSSTLKSLNDKMDDIKAYKTIDINDDDTDNIRE